jgi:hypothetical protein
LLTTTKTTTMMTTTNTTNTTTMMTRMANTMTMTTRSTNTTMANTRTKISTTMTTTTTTMTTTMTTTTTTMTMTMTTNTTTVTSTAVGGNDNGCNSDGRGHRQQSTKIGSKDTMAVATAMETAAAGAAMTATARQWLPWVLLQMESPSPPPGRVVGAGCDGCVWGCACWLYVCCAPLLFC